ncbi:hypothetical protein PQR15_38330 [Streptomyces lydicus]|nr:hypothetical protein [Streptomyces lydicus]
MKSAVQPTRWGLHRIVESEHMRILITAQAIYSHLAPLVLPVAERARAAGHEVAIATGPSVIEHVDKRGLTALTLPHLQSMGEAFQSGELQPPPGMEKAGSVTSNWRRTSSPRPSSGTSPSPAPRTSSKRRRTGNPT